MSWDILISIYLLSGLAVATITAICADPRQANKKDEISDTIIPIIHIIAWPIIIIKTIK